MKALVGIVMGSDSDLPVMCEAAKVLDVLGVSYRINIVSAHRTPDYMFTYARSAKENDLKVIIAGAGGAAHLPGMMASLTAVPVIGVPVQSKMLSGLDSLYSIVQMPPGIPVATMSINGAQNAGILAAEIIGTFDLAIYNRVVQYKEELKQTVLEKNKNLENAGFEAYLKNYL